MDKKVKYNKFKIGKLTFTLPNNKPTDKLLPASNSKKTDGTITMLSALPEFVSPPSVSEPVASIIVNAADIPYRISA